MNDSEDSGRTKLLFFPKLLSLWKGLENVKTRSPKPRIHLLISIKH